MLPYLDVPCPLIGLVGHLLLHARQLLLQVGHFILVQLGEVIQLLLQALIPVCGGRGALALEGLPPPRTPPSFQGLMMVMYLLILCGAAPTIPSLQGSATSPGRFPHGPPRATLGDTHCQPPLSALYL